MGRYRAAASKFPECSAESGWAQKSRTEIKVSTPTPEDSPTVRVAY